MRHNVERKQIPYGAALATITTSSLQDPVHLKRRIPVVLESNILGSATKRKVS